MGINDPFLPYVNEWLSNFQNDIMSLESLYFYKKIAIAPIVEKDIGNIGGI